MNDAWASLITTALWLLLTIVVLIRSRHHLANLLDSLTKRVLKGAPISIGPVNIGAAPASLPTSVEGSATSEGAEGVETPQEISSRLLAKNFPEGIVEDIYLIHTAEVIRERTAQAPPLFRVRVWVEADTEQLMDGIQRVSYRLHDTFPKKVIGTEARGREFEVWMTIYGEFKVVACVERQGAPTVWVTRYLDLPGRPPE